MRVAITSSTVTDPLGKRVRELFQEQHQTIIKHTDRMFAGLMICQWIFGIVIALIVSPLAWSGTHSQIHIHLLAAIFLGGLLTGFPVFFALRHPGETFTRHMVGIGQVMMSALLIHLTGGRIETHFHVFGSLAILAFYRDWRVLVSATAVVYFDHLLRGIFWAPSVYGVASASIWRSMEHAGWVIFEVTFLIISIRTSLKEMEIVAERQAKLEALNEVVEGKIAERTTELTRENSERRHAETSLKRSQAQLARAQQIARLGSWEWDIVNDRVTWSEEAARLYERAPIENGIAMDKSLEGIHAEDVQRVKNALNAAIHKKQPYDCNYRLSLPDGAERVLHAIAEVLLAEDQSPLKMIGTVQDVTEMRRSEEALRRSDEQLRQSQKMEAVGRLAGGVAHDFNNLLTVITGYSALLLRQMDQNHPSRKDAEEIQNAAERAAALTSQLLAFSRKQVLQPRVLQMNDVLAGMERMLRRLIGEHIELTTTLDPELGHIRADPGQIEQVILNLAVNSRDAMPQGGKLSIRTSNVRLEQKIRLQSRDMDEGDYVMLAISDTGVGMTDEVKAHLFEPFFTTKGVGRGTGLGLATCFGIVNQSGGTIRAYSEPNCGTTFKIYLPRVNATATAPLAPSGPGVLPTGTESVLIVEDDAAVRRLAGKVLIECGYRLYEAQNALDGLATLDRLPQIRLVITDVIMPKMSGKEMFDQIKRRRLDVKVLFMSGYTDDALANHLILEPGLLFLEKPFTPSSLAQKVRDVLDAP